jgi:2-C-methyl-D-erythritol 4-phosphate cytidylyltransferase
MRNSVIIVAGGTGKRMGTALPKQFLEVNGKPLIMFTIEKFLEFDPSIEIVLVINRFFLDYWMKIENTYGLNYPLRIISGGETRFQSVKNGISLLEGESLVGIHDSVRPLVSVEAIRRVYAEAEISGAAIPCIPLKESVREISDKSSRPLDRSLIQVVQTPQVFRSEILNKAYQTVYNEAFTDDASVVEKAGYDISIVHGDEYNLKITTPEDFEIAKILLNLQKQPLH